MGNINLLILNCYLCITFLLVSDEYPKNNKRYLRLFNLAYIYD